MNICLIRAMSNDYAAEDKKIIEHMKSLNLRLISTNTTQTIGLRGMQNSVRHLIFETKENISKDYFFGVASQIETLINKKVKVNFD